MQHRTSDCDGLPASLKTARKIRWQLGFRNRLYIPMFRPCSLQMPSHGSQGGEQASTGPTQQLAEQCPILDSSSPHVCFDAKQTWLRVAGRPRASSPAPSRSSARRRTECTEHPFHQLTQTACTHFTSRRLCAWSAHLSQSPTPGASSWPVSRQPRPPLGLRPYYCG